MSDRDDVPSNILRVELCRKDFVVKKESTFVYVAEANGVLTVFYSGEVEELLARAAQCMPSFNIFQK